MVGLAAGGCGVCWSSKAWCVAAAVAVAWAGGGAREWPTNVRPATRPTRSPSCGGKACVQALSAHSARVSPLLGEAPRATARPRGVGNAWRPPLRVGLGKARLHRVESGPGARRGECPRRNHGEAAAAPPRRRVQACGALHLDQQSGVSPQRVDLCVDGAEGRLDNLGVLAGRPTLPLPTRLYTRSKVALLWKHASGW